LYNCFLSYALRWKLGGNPNILFFENMRATGKEIAEHVTRPEKVIPNSHVQARCVHLLFITHRCWNILKMVEVMRESRMVGKRMIVVLT